MTHPTTRGATGARAVLICAAVGLLSLISLSAAQSTAWGQVPLSLVYPNALLLSTVGFWANAAGLLLAALGVIALNAWRVSWAFAIIAAALAVMAFAPPLPVAVVALALAAALAIQAGYFKGELGKVVAIDIGKAQAIVGGTFTVGLSFCISGVAFLGEMLGARMYAVLAVATLASCAAALAIFRRRADAQGALAAEAEPLEPLAAVGAKRPQLLGRLRTRGWSGPTLYAALASLLSSGTTGAMLAPLPTVLDTEGFGGPFWLFVASATHIPVGIVLMTAWAKYCPRWGDRGLRLAGVAQLIGPAVLGVSLLLMSGSTELVCVIAGLLLLNLGRAAYDASLFAVAAPGGQEGVILTVAAGIGAALGSLVANVGVTAGVIAWPAMTAAVFAGASLALTWWRVPAAPSTAEVPRG